ncbi:hypothetical protein ACFL4G_05175 [Thermodesulfobacteriota bacterium]
MKRHLFYTFLVVFVVTAVVALLGVTRVVSIEGKYLWPLLSALIIESACAVIALFKGTVFFSPGTDVQDHESNHASQVANQGPADGECAHEHDEQRGVVEIVRIYSKGQEEMDDLANAQGLTIWDQIYTSDIREYDILGHTCAAIRKRETTIRSCAEKGGSVRILLLNPVYGLHSQLPETAHLINWTIEDGDLHEVTKLHRKITDTVHFVFRLKATLSADRADNVQLRLAAGTMYHNVTRADDLMCVTHYLSGVKEQGQSGPSFLIGRRSRGGLFEQHYQEFNSLWEEAISAERATMWQDRLRALAPYMSAAVEAYNAYVKSDPSLIPLPVSAIVFPTYRCEDHDGERLCKYCSFNGFPTHDMPPDEFEKIVSVLCTEQDGPLIKSLELAGGGEPLQHKEALDILHVLRRVRKKRPDLELGLLTNGLHARDEILNDLDIFDYVRVSIPEKYTLLPRESPDWNEYKTCLLGLKNVMRAKRFGCKLLVTRDNLPNVADLVRWAFDEIGFQHVKVKAVRDEGGRPEAKDLTTLADRLWTIRSERKAYSGLSVDFPENVLLTSRACWVSPLVAVVDPLLDVYKCCSISMALPPSCPNRIDRVRFTDVTHFVEGWKSREHLNVIKKVDVDRVCNNPSVADCRFVEYQRILESLLSPLVEIVGGGRLNML